MGLSYRPARLCSLTGYGTITLYAIVRFIAPVRDCELDLRTFFVLHWLPAKNLNYRKITWWYTGTKNVLALYIVCLLMKAQHGRAKEN
jgi:hypothetical protein